MTQDDQFTITITPPKRTPALNWKELWRYRDLFITLSWRDVAIRYKQTAIGALWAVLQPLVTLVIFTFIFNRVAHVQSGDKTPYPLFLYVGLILWQFYSGTLTKASESLVANQNLVQKVYFPRLILPASTLATAAVDLFFSGLVFLFLLLYYRVPIHLGGFMAVPVIGYCLGASALGGGFFLSALNVKYRDVRYALPFFIQTLMYVTPVIYPAQMLDHYPIAKEAMLVLNPVAVAITTARSSLFSADPLQPLVLLTAVLISSGYFLIGLWYFR